MLRLLFIGFVFLTNSFIHGQTVGYGLSLGTPVSNTIKIGNNYGTYEYKRSPEISLILTLSNDSYLRNQTELRLTTFSSDFFSQSDNEFEISTTNKTLRRYLVELQYFLYSFDLRKFGDISLGSKISYIIRSDIEGQTFSTSNGLDIIESSSYDRGIKLHTFISLRFSTKPININKDLRILPSYTYNHSFRNDLANVFVDNKLSSHIFGLLFITDLSPKNKK